MNPALSVMKYEMEIASLRKDLERVSRMSKERPNDHQSHLLYEEDDSPAEVVQTVSIYRKLWFPWFSSRDCCD
jgi:hypothetical protein